MKGKGEMTTFWINGKSGRSAPTKDEVSMRASVKFNLTIKMKYISMPSWNDKYVNLPISGFPERSSRRESR